MLFGEEEKGESRQYEDRSPLLYLFSSPTTDHGCALGCCNCREQGSAALGIA